MATLTTEQVEIAAAPEAAAIHTIAVPAPPASGTVALVVQMPAQAPPRSPEWYEASGLTAAATMIGILFTVGFGVWNTHRQITKGAEEADRKRMHDVEEAERGRKHAAGEAQLARLMSARREVYADLIDKFVAVQAMFGEMKGADLKGEDFGKRLREFGAPVNKTWLLSEPETAYKARELHSMLNEQFFALLPRLSEINLARLSIQDEEGAAERLRAEFQEVRRRSDGQDHESLQRIGEAANRVGASTLVHHKRLAVLLREYNDAMLAFQPTTMKGVNTLMLSARREMGLAGDTAKLEAQSSDMVARAMAAMAELEAKFQKQEAAAERGR